MTKSMAWQCGFCDNFYKHIPKWAVPRWMNAEETLDWKRGWNFARRL